MTEVYYTIEPSRHSEGDWNVISHGTYENWRSVLDGQPKRSFEFGCPTKEGCIRYCEIEHLNYTIKEGSTYHPQPMSDLPPDWFDETNAGEEW